MHKEHRNLKRRILVINASPDVPEQYLPVMNCIFSAQKQVCVCVCVCGYNKYYL